MRLSDKHFNAILSKNGIIRELGNINLEDIDDKEIQANIRDSIFYIINQMKVIEAYIGEGNQPSIDDIVKGY